MQTPENTPQLDAPSPDAALETPANATEEKPAETADASTRAPRTDPAPVTFATVTTGEAPPEPQNAPPIASAPAAPAATPDVAAAEAENSAPVEVQEPPRALFPGSFLAGEYEIKTVLSRGATNIYEAQHGDYGNTTACLIAEREIVVPVAAPPQNTPAESDASTREPSVETPINVSADEAAGSGAFVEDVDTLASSPLPKDEQAASTRDESPEGESGLASNGLDLKASAAAPASAGEIALESALFPPRKSFTQEDREYLVFEYFESQALQDHREATNDERALSMLIALSQGLAELEAKKLHAVLSTDTLRVDGNGALSFLGFVGASSDIEAATYVKQLRDCTSFILKRVFAESSTMSLEDEFGALAFSEELKEIARKISGGGYSRVADAAQDLKALLPGGKIRIDAALLSDVGQERELNEDAGFITCHQRAAHLGARDYDLYVVADGMGGHEGGEVASDLTLTSLQNRIDEYSRELDFNDNVAVRAMLIQVMDAVNADVVALTETPRYRGTRAKPGATLCFALRVGARAFFGNVGDSRAYKWTPQHGLERVSKDHSYVQSLIDRGEITEEEAFVHPDGSIITAHIGYPKLKTRDVFLRLVSPGDKILIVSDGVTDMLRDAAIAPFVQQPDSAAICRTLVDASNAAGGLDNITALCVIFS